MEAILQTKQAKLLRPEDVDELRRLARRSLNPVRNEVIVLLSTKAGLRAAEIAGLTWPMVLTADGRIDDVMEVRNRIAKKGGGRAIPIHPDLKAMLVRLMRGADLDGPVIVSGRGGHLKPHSLVRFFERRYRDLGLTGCSSHSGRRTFITQAARNVHKVGGSIRDVMSLAGHKNVEMTLRYVESDTVAKRQLVNLI
jgi:integrase/recombinase XerD